MSTRSKDATSLNGIPVSVIVMEMTRFDASQEFDEKHSDLHAFAPLVYSLRLPVVQTGSTDARNMQ